MDNTGRLSIPISPTSQFYQSAKNVVNVLPQLLHTPAGLALLEMQGSINLPTPGLIDSLDDAAVASSPAATPIGRLVFSDYCATAASGTAWRERVYLYVGRHQRLTGTVKELPRAIAILRRTGLPLTDDEDEAPHALEIVQIIKWKIIFNQRPEPVGIHEILP
jgi:hypothetical protein